MKVILNKDLSTLGEEGDVKDVARGYARNYLFPRGIALPYTPQTVKIFEARKEEIAARKETKRQDALGLKEKLEAVALSITVPAGANGKLYGAVTSQTVADELAKQGFQIERKRIELAAAHIKSVGKYKAVIKLYESAAAEIQITIIGQEIKTEAPHAPAKPRRRRDEADAARTRETAAGETAAPEAQSEPAPVSNEANASGEANIPAEVNTSSEASATAEASATVEAGSSSEANSAGNA